VFLFFGKDGDGLLGFTIDIQASQTGSLEEGRNGLPRILPGAGAEGQHPTVGRSKARMGVRLLGRAMLGQTVVAAIIYGFVGTD